MKHRISAICVGSVLAVACAKNVPQTTASTTAAAPEPASTTAGSESSASPGLGGRLFDDWITELHANFVPDNPATPEADGRGGPFGNGTLPGADGKPLLNTGHDYRLKNLMGWDLRGAEGLYGPEYENRAHVLLPNLLTNTESREVWIARLERGEDAMPAFGSVLTRAQIEALVDFMLAIRDGKLPQPDEIYALSKTAPNHYVLVPGGDASTGHALFASTCAGCHGADGRKVLFEGGKQSVGSYARTEAYETWLKILSGQPGSKMHAMLPIEAPRAELAHLIRDLNAALCDRTRYPAPDGVAEVADGDPRCGAHLK